MLTPEQKEKQKRLIEIVEGSDKVVFFGGAGVSTESGIPDFRSAKGVYNQEYPYPPEQVVSHTFFMAHPDIFYDFYRNRFMYPDAKPNQAHIKLAELERQGHLQAIITQNADGLHQEAGSTNVFELHGCGRRNYCMDCGKRFGFDYITGTEGVPLCDECGGIVRPDIVLFEEKLSQVTIAQSLEAIAHADVLVVAGTSLAVYPAARFLEYFSGGHLVVINLSPTPADSHADLLIDAPVGEVFDW